MFIYLNTRKVSLYFLMQRGEFMLWYSTKITQNQYSLYLTFCCFSNSNKFHPFIILFRNFVYFILFFLHSFQLVSFTIYSSNVGDKFRDFLLFVFVVSILIASLHKTKERFAVNTYVYLNNITFNESSLSLNVNREFDDKL